MSSTRAPVAASARPSQADLSGERLVRQKRAHALLPAAVLLGGEDMQEILQQVERAAVNEALRKARRGRRSLKP
jgi:hypothetical protein